MTGNKNATKHFIGKKLKLMRIEAEMSLENLSKKLGVNVASISKYENNKMLPRPARVEKMAEIFGVSPDDFYEKSEAELDKHQAAINALPIILSQEDKSFVYFFMTRSRVQKERLIGILQGILLGDIQNDK